LFQGEETISRRCEQKANPAENIILRLLFRTRPKGRIMKYYLVFVQENGNVREVQEKIEVDYKTYIEIFEKVRE